MAHITSLHFTSIDESESKAIEYERRVLLGDVARHRLERVERRQEAAARRHLRPRELLHALLRHLRAVVQALRSPRAAPERTRTGT